MQKRMRRRHRKIWASGQWCRSLQNKELLCPMFRNGLQKPDPYKTKNGAVAWTDFGYEVGSYTDYGIRYESDGNNVVTEAHASTTCWKLKEKNSISRESRPRYTIPEPANTSKRQSTTWPRPGWLRYYRSQILWEITKPLWVNILKQGSWFVYQISCAKLEVRVPFFNVKGWISWSVPYPDLYDYCTSLENFVNHHHPPPLIRVITFYLHVCHLPFFEYDQPTCVLHLVRVSPYSSLKTFNPSLMCLSLVCLKIHPIDMTQVSHFSDFNSILITSITHILHTYEPDEIVICFKKFYLCIT